MSGKQPMAAWPGLARAYRLALAYQAAGQLEQAIPLSERTLAERERVLGETHPGTLTSRNNLAAAYQDAGGWTRLKACGPALSPDRDCYALWQIPWKERKRYRPPEGNRMSVDDDLVGHAGTAVTEEIYRHQLKPVIIKGAETMNAIFNQHNQAKSA